MDFIIKVLAGVSVILLSGAVLGILAMWRSQGILEGRVKRIEEDIAGLQEEVRQFSDVHGDIQIDLEQIDTKIEILLRQRDP